MCYWWLSLTRCVTCVADGEARGKYKMENKSASGMLGMFLCGVGRAMQYLDWTTEIRRLLGTGRTGRGKDLQGGKGIIGESADLRHYPAFGVLAKKKTPQSRIRSRHEDSGYG